MQCKQKKKNHTNLIAIRLHIKNDQGIFILEKKQKPPSIFISFLHKTLESTEVKENADFSYFQG